jgi:hypothetical protein
VYWRLAIIPVLLATLSSFAATDPKPPAPGAAERMQQSGPEEQELKRRAGSWTVKATFRPTPDAQPLVTEQLVAERKMVGLYMEEVMHPDAGAKMPRSRPVADDLEQLLASLLAAEQRDVLRR